MGYVTLRQAEDKIGTREPFKNSTGNLWAVTVSPEASPIGTGRLPHDMVKPLNERIREGRITYVIYSHQTPIAWLLDGHLDVPDIRYSQTTTKYQNLIRRAS